MPGKPNIANHRRILARAREGGPSLREIARDVGVSYTMVRRVLKKYRYAPSGRKGPDQAFDREAMSQDRKSGMTFDQIAKKHGCSYKTAWKSTFHIAKVRPMHIREMSAYNCWCVDLKTAASALGISDRTLSKRAKESGAPDRPQRRTKPEHEKRRIVMAFRDGDESLSSVARRFGVIPKQVRQYCEEFGVDANMPKDSAPRSAIDYGQREHAAWMAEHVTMHRYGPLGASSLVG